MLGLIYPFHAMPSSSHHTADQKYKWLNLLQIVIAHKLRAFLDK